MKIVVLFILALSPAFGNKYKGHEVITFTTKSQEQLNGFIRSIANLSEVIDFWSPSSINHVKPNVPTDAMIPRDHIRSLKNTLVQHEINFDVKIDDVEDLIEKQATTQRNRRDLDYNYDVYHTYEEIEDWTREIVKQYPNLARRSLLGKSFEKRNISKLTLGSSDDNPKILIDCGIHAREWIAPAFCQCYVNRLLSSYHEVDEIKEMMDHLTFIIIPLLNPDGYAYSHKKDRLWRKTRSKYSGSRCVGVDPNRNFDARWSGPGSSPRPCSTVYYGPSKSSEPMTKALTGYIDNNVDTIKAYITFHSYGQVIVFPYSYAVKKVKNYEEHVKVAKATSDAIYKVNRKRYTYGPGYRSMYLAAGGSDDMAKDHGVGLVYTIELRDLGNYGFLLPASQINGVCEETYAGMDVIAKHIMKKTRTK